MYLAKSTGYNFKNFAKPFSGIIYYAGLFGNKNEIYIVVKAFRKLIKTHVACWIF